ncbi:MAG: hypothetical protein ACREB8_07045 [Pseudolabrys sp.]
MDRTAIASVIVGLGGAIAAMVFPTKYPRTPKLIINGIWWVGIVLIVFGTTYLFSEHPISDLRTMAKNTIAWLFGHVVTVQRLPGFWLVIAFLIGIAANKYVFPYIKKLIRRRNKDLHAGEWFPPREAIQRFINPALLSRQKQARSFLAELSADSEKRPLAEYIVTCSDADVINNLYDQIGAGYLIAKGFPVRKGKTQPVERLIDYTFWKLRVVGRMLDLDTGEGCNLFEHFRNITIARAAAPPSHGSLDHDISFTAPLEQPHQALAPQDTPERT